MKQLKQMKETLMSAVQNEISHLDTANCHELGAAIDMIKDLSEAIYYCSIVESMEDSVKEQKKMKEMEQMMNQRQPQSMMYFYEKDREYPPEYYRDMDRDKGRMYYSENGGTRHSGTNRVTSHNDNNTYMQGRDEREGKSGERRKTYMETKQMNTDKNAHIKELDQYAQELTQDIMEMIHEAGPEEKQLLKKKMTELASKIV